MKLLFPGFLRGCAALMAAAGFFLLASSPALASLQPGPGGYWTYASANPAEIQITWRSSTGTNGPQVDTFRLPQAVVSAECGASEILTLHPGGNPNVFLCEGREVAGTGVAKAITGAIMVCGESSVQFETLAGTAMLNNTYFFKSYATCIGSTGTLPESEGPASPAEKPSTGPSRVIIEQAPPIIIHVPPNLGPTTGPLVKFVNAPGSCVKTLAPPKKKSAKTKSSSAASSSCSESSLGLFVKEITEGGLLGPKFGVKTIRLGTVTNLVSVPVTFTETISPEVFNLTPAELALPPSQLLQQIPVSKTVNSEGILSKAGTKILRKPDRCSKALNKLHFNLTVKAVDPAGDQQTIVKHVTISIKKLHPGRCINGDTDGDNDGD